MESKPNSTHEPAGDTSALSTPHPRPRQQEQPSSEPTVYRYVPVSSGGTYDFTGQTPQYIGTSKCITCVGVYFVIDQSRCFAAHIDADTMTKTGDYSRKTNETLAVKIRAEVLRMLDGEQHRPEWGAVTDTMRSSLVLNCRKMRWTLPLVGDAVSAAVQEWLGIANPVRPQEEAFIVRHSDGEAQYFDMEASNRQWYKQEEAANEVWAVLVQDEA